jgi:uncharacterized phage protein (TIGR01671 family)
MRGIKFRVWSVEDNEMHDFNWFLESDYGQSCIWQFLNRWEVEKYVSMQYTGLKDKNGIEIYEGDVLKNDNYDKTRKWVVEYRIDSEYVGFVKVCQYDHDQGKSSTFMSWKDCEVIGNIYENSELLATPINQEEEGK